MSKKELSRPGIYAIINTRNGKAYVGSAANIYNRWSVHRAMLRGGRHDSIVVQRAWNKYGEDAFVWEVLEFCDKDDLADREQYWLVALNSGANNRGYNIRLVVTRNTGLRHTPETRAKISAAKKGVPQPPEAVARRAAANRGRKLAPEVIARRKTRRGIGHTEKQRQRISDGRKITPDDVIDAIQQMIDEGLYTQSEIARRFGVHQSHVSRIKNKRLTRLNHGNDPNTHTPKTA